MTLAYKYRMYPTKEQATTLASFFGCTRLLYNELLSWWKTEYDAAKQEERKMDKLPLVTFFKQQHDFLDAVDSLALMNARRHLEAALKLCFKNKTSRFPRFKKRGKSRDSYTTSCVNGNIAVGDGTVRLPKLGSVRCVTHRRLPDGAKILTATVSRERDGRHYVSVCFEIEQNTYAQRKADGDMKVVGLDMSMRQFAVSSDGNDDVAKTKYVARYRESERKMRRLSREVSRKKAGSNNRDKAKRRLARLSQRVSNRRRDFCIKTAVHYATNYDVIVLEDIDMKNMSRTLNLGKSVMDLGFGEFRKWLDWQCVKHGSAVFYADRWFASSKTCNRCGEKNDGLKLSDRRWICPHCGAEIDRDYNAACNLRDYFLKIYNTAGTAEINASGDNVRNVVASLQRSVSMKEEAAWSLTKR